MLLARSEMIATPFSFYQRSQQVGTKIKILSTSNTLLLLPPLLSMKDPSQGDCGLL